MTTPKWDLFIAHASEDKNGFVRPLAEQLRAHGAHVWYDEFQLQPGHSLVATIDRGLANSAFGLLIISKAFLHKPWPDYERRGLTTREIAGDSVVIPVWRDVTHAEVTAFSPSLADKYAFVTKDADVLALEVLRVIRPDIFKNLSRRAAQERHSKSQPAKTVPIANIITDVPPKHQTLPNSLMCRLLLIHEAVSDVLPEPFADTVLGFRRDAHPEDEAEVWELIAAIYLYIMREDDIPPAGREEVFGLALTASMRPLTEEDDSDLEYITVARFEEIRQELEGRVNMFNRDST